MRMSVFGNIVIPLRFNYAGDFERGLARVRQGGKCFFINRKGERITPEFDGAFDFSEDLAAVEVDHKIGYIRRDGTFALPVRGGGYWEAAAGKLPPDTYIARKVEVRSPTMYPNDCDRLGRVLCSRKHHAGADYIVRLSDINQLLRELSWHLMLRTREQGNTSDADNKFPCHVQMQYGEPGRIVSLWNRPMISGMERVTAH